MKVDSRAFNIKGDANFNEAFYNCYNLKEIDDYAFKIGGNLDFRWGLNYTAIERIGNYAFDIGGNADFTLALVYKNNNLEIYPLEIGEYAFKVGGYLNIANFNAEYYNLDLTSSPNSFVGEYNKDPLYLKIN